MANDKAKKWQADREREKQRHPSKNNDSKPAKRQTGKGHDTNRKGSKR